MQTLKGLCWADSFAAFCSQHFRRTKRFGLEGSESLVLGMNAAVERAGELGAEYVVVGMPHRGRLNVLANVARKPLEQLRKLVQDLLALPFHIRVQRVG